MIVILSHAWSWQTRSPMPWLQHFCRTWNRGWRSNTVGLPQNKYQNGSNPQQGSEWPMLIGTQKKNASATKVTKCLMWPSWILMFYTGKRRQQNLPHPSEKNRVEKKLVADSLSVVKTVVSSLKTLKSKATTTTHTVAKQQNHTSSATNSQTVASQMSTITQLMEQVSILQLAHNKINSKLDKLTKFIMA